MGQRVKRGLSLAGVAVGAAVPVACSVVQPAGLSPSGACVLGILVGAIIWWIAGLVPEYVTALAMAVLLVLVAGIPSEVVLSSFASETWWLLLAAFGLGFAMQDCGLIRRISLRITGLFPKTYPAQVAGICVAGTLVGPLIPSLSAKAVMLTPIALGISDSMGYERKGREATGLFLAAFTSVRNVAPAIVSASCMGYALQGLLPADVAARFDIIGWFVAMLPWFLLVSVLNYLFISLLYRPRGGAPSAAASPTPATAPSAPAPRSPLSRRERQMAAIMAACVLLWVLEPFHHVPAFAVAMAALALALGCGIVSKADFRNGVPWDSLVFIGVSMGLAKVFAFSGLDAWVIGLCQPGVAFLAQSPYLFIVGIGVATVLLRFLVISEMAYLYLFAAFMFPLAVSLGISPWIVAVSVYALVNPWFLPYQNVIYLSSYYSVDGQMASHAAAAKYCGIYLLTCLAALLLSVPLWRSMGLL